MVFPELNNRPTILDGGLGTYLSSLGYDLNDKLWSGKVLRDQPSVIRQAHVAYYEAGADMVITASYQLAVDTCGSQAQLKALCNQSVELAHEARSRCLSGHLNNDDDDDDGDGDDTELQQPQQPQQQLQQRTLYIGGSIGCFGAAQHDGSEYTGRYRAGCRSVDALKSWHTPRFKILATHPLVDVLAIETIPCLNEVEALLQLLGEFPEKRAYLSVVCQDAHRLTSGETVADCAALIRRYMGKEEEDASESRRCVENLIAVGVNCTSPKYVTDLITAFQRGCPRVPVLVYPNTGESWDDSTHTWCWHTDRELDGPRAQFLSYAQHWVEQGVVGIGGCCRTTPEYIKELADLSHDATKPM